MSEGTPARETLFARLLCDVMIPAEFSAAIRAQGYDVAEARVLPVEIQQDDHAILRAAAQQRRVVVTCNYSGPQSNFCLIHEEWRALGYPPLALEHCQHLGQDLVKRHPHSSPLLQSVAALEAA
jgi:hypothetical protein